MSLQAIPPRRLSSPALSLLRFVHDRNPFYLLSALSMFVGYRVVLSALDSAPGDWRSLLGLIAVSQAYEAVIIALALYLIVRRGLHRDGWILLGVQSLFLVDLTNLNAELFTASPRLGSAVNAVCFGLAMGKIAVVLRVLKLRLTPATALYVAAQLAFLLALPGGFRLIRSPAATVSPLGVYAVWWAAGGLLAVGAAVVRGDRSTHPFARLPMRLYVLVPLASLLVHLASENRVFWLHFQPANLTPVLLAGIVAVNRRPRYAFQLRLSLLLAALALWASIVPAEGRELLMAHAGQIAVSPLRLALVGVGVAGCWLAVRHRSWPIGVAVAGCGGLALVGSSVQDIVRRLARADEWATDLSLRLVPTTPLQWGCVAIIAAFVLLAVGAVVSLRPGTVVATDASLGEGSPA